MTPATAPDGENAPGGGLRRVGTAEPRQVERGVRARGADGRLESLGQCRLDRGDIGPPGRRIDEQHRASALAVRGRLGDGVAGVLAVGGLRRQHHQVDEVHLVECREAGPDGPGARVLDSDRDGGDAPVLEEALQRAAQRAGMNALPDRVLVGSPAVDPVDRGRPVERAALGEPHEGGDVRAHSLDRSVHLACPLVGRVRTRIHGASLLRPVVGVKRKPSESNVGRTT